MRRVKTTPGRRWCVAIMKPMFRFSHVLRSTVLAAMAVCLMPVVALAEVASATWEQLTAAQQEVLRPMRERWDALTPERQQRLLKGVERWQNMTPEERVLAKQRMQRWRDLDPERRQRLRERVERFKELPPAQQARIRERYEQLKKLPPAQRQQLRERWQLLTPEEQLREKLRYGVRLHLLACVTITSVRESVNKWSLTPMALSVDHGLRTEAKV